MKSSRCDDAMSSHLCQAPSLTASAGPRVQCPEMWALVPGTLKACHTCSLPQPQPPGCPMSQANDNVIDLFYQFLLLLEKISHRVDSILKKAQSPSFSPAQWQWEVAPPTCTLEDANAPSPSILPSFTHYAFWKHNTPELILIPLPVSPKPYFPWGQKCLTRKVFNKQIKQAFFFF